MGQINELADIVQQLTDRITSNMELDTKYRELYTEQFDRLERKITRLEEFIAIMEINS